MAGVYIHVPFCKKRCSYCDFFSSTLLDKKDSIVKTIVKEIDIKKTYLGNEPVETIYFGGGTPSLLNINELESLLNTIRSNFEVVADAEITLEANPDDINQEQLFNWKILGINRLSIGIQSTNDDLLKLMNRRHDAKQAINCVQLAYSAGFDNISIDLIYGLPGLTNKAWMQQLDLAFSLPISHLSSYHLTIEEDTIFSTMCRQGKIHEMDEDESLQQFESLISKANEYGFENYEISNFCKSGKHSKHNTSYWQGKKYLGAGPSAHSFNKQQRGWNASDLDAYIYDIQNNINFASVEYLSETDKYNEYIMTRLRTIWGVNTEELENFFGLKKLEFFNINVKKHLENGLMQKSHKNISFTRKGIFVADAIIADLFSN
jgi:oxygen-independent coproporphyrinogen-3 oxidase